MMRTLLEGRKTGTSPSVCAGACGSNRNCSALISSMMGRSNVRVGQARRGAAGELGVTVLHEAEPHDEPKWNRIEGPPDRRGQAFVEVYGCAHVGSRGGWGCNWAHV